MNRLHTILCFILFCCSIATANDDIALSPVGAEGAKMTFLCQNGKKFQKYFDISSKSCIFAPDLKL